MKYKIFKIKIYKFINILIYLKILLRKEEKFIKHKFYFALKLKLNILK